MMRARTGGFRWNSSSSSPSWSRSAAPCTTTRGAEVTALEKGPGHAGFSYIFSVASRGSTESWFMRLPPPNVRWVGTADVLRQVSALNALDGTTVPHCSVKWSGDDLQWFGCPYFVVPKLEGSRDALRGQSGWRGSRREHRWGMARQAMTALAGIHRVDWRRAPYLGDPIPFDDDVIRWDRFMPKVAEPQRLRLVPDVRQLLLDHIPKETNVGIFHGDFQWANLFYSDGPTPGRDRLGARRGRRHGQRRGLDRDLQRPGGLEPRARAARN